MVVFGGYLHFSGFTGILLIHLSSLAVLHNTSIIDIRVTTVKRILYMVGSVYYHCRTMERKTTSVKIDPQLWKNFKKYAIDHDKDLSEILEELIREKVK